MLSTKIKITPPLVAIICLLGIISLQAQRRSNSESAINTYVRAEIAQKTQLDLYKDLPDFGFNNLMADRTYLEYIQYFGDRSAREHLGYELVPEYFAAIVDRDLNFTEAYLSLITANSLYAGEPQTTVNLMDRNLPHISLQRSEQLAQLWSQKGTDELLFLGDIAAAKKSYQMAAYSASQINEERGQELTESYLAMLKFLATNPDTKDAQILAWSTVLPNIKDDRRRQEIIDKINNLKQETSNK
jgi:hypothetical protein